MSVKFSLGFCMGMMCLYHWFSMGMKNDVPQCQDQITEYRKTMPTFFFSALLLAITTFITVEKL